VRADGEAGRREQEGQRIAHCVLVVDDMHHNVDAHASGSDITGRVNVKVAPPAALRATSMVPPWDSMMRLLMVRPMPMPDAFDDTNGWKSCGAMSSAMPGPVSSTSTLSMPSGASLVRTASSRLSLSRM